MILHNVILVENMFDPFPSQTNLSVNSDPANLTLPSTTAGTTTTDPKHYEKLYNSQPNFNSGKNLFNNKIL